MRHGSQSMMTVAAMVVVAVLAGCSPVAGPSASESVEPDRAATAEPSASATAAAVADPAPAASCGSIDVNQPTVDGDTLGNCFSEMLQRFGTARARFVTGDRQQDAEIQLRPEVAIHSVSIEPDGSSEAVLVDGVAYQNEGEGWVRGDADSTDDDEMAVGAAGDAMVAAFSGGLLRESIAACPSWVVEHATERITLPNDFVVDARVFSCAAQFESFGTTISDYRVWFDASWRPVGSESTATGFGQAVTGTQLYYDLGVPVEIEAPI